MSSLFSSFHSSDLSTAATQSRGNETLTHTTAVLTHHLSLLPPYLPHKGTQQRRVISRRTPDLLPGTPRPLRSAAKCATRRPNHAHNNLRRVTRRARPSPHCKRVAGFEPRVCSSNNNIDQSPLLLAKKDHQPPSLFFFFSVISSLFSRGRRRRRPQRGDPLPIRSFCNASGARLSLPRLSPPPQPKTRRKSGEIPPTSLPPVTPLSLPPPSSSPKTDGRTTNAPSPLAQPPTKKERQSGEQPTPSKKIRWWHTQSHHPPPPPPSPPPPPPPPASAHTALRRVVAPGAPRADPRPSRADTTRRRFNR